MNVSGLSYRQHGPDAIQRRYTVVSEMARCAWYAGARISVAAAMLIGVAGCVSVPEDLAPAKNFEVERYLGKWYEIARLDHSFERGLTDVTATYTARADGGLDVVNRGYDTAGGAWRSATGRAYFLGARDVASLKVTFFWPFYGGYHVIALHREHYQYALVAGPDRHYLWLLAREPKLPESTMRELLAFAEESGFVTDDLILVSHDRRDP